MIYNSFFGFNEEPFGVTPDPKFIYMSKRHEEALAHIMFGIKEHRGFVMLTGEIGSGKTTLIRYLLSTLNEKTHSSIVLNPMVDPLDFLKLINHDFGIEGKSITQKDLMDSLNNFLIECYSNGEKAVLVIDEAQEMSIECLEFVRLLSNFETDTHKLLQVVLVGQPELKELIQGERLRQLDQRISVRYHLQPLDEKDTGRYIKHRLKVAGGESLIFPKGVIKAIYKASRGIARLINLYVDRALMLAYAEGKHKITTTLIKKTLKEIETTKRHPYLKPALTGVVIFLTLLLITFGIISRENDFLKKPKVEQKEVYNSLVYGLKNETDSLKNTLSITNVTEPTSISMLDGIYRTTDPVLAENACVLNLLHIWDEKDLKVETPSEDIKKRGYSQYEFKDKDKIMKFKLPLILELKENSSTKPVVLRWLIGRNALIIDPRDGKKILPFIEIKDNIINIKLFYKSRHKLKKDKADEEKMILNSIDKSTPRLVL